MSTDNEQQNETSGGTVERLDGQALLKRIDNTIEEKAAGIFDDMPEETQDKFKDMCKSVFEEMAEAGQGPAFQWGKNPFTKSVESAVRQNAPGTDAAMLQAVDRASHRLRNEKGNYLQALKAYGQSGGSRPMEARQKAMAEHGVEPLSRHASHLPHFRQFEMDYPVGTGYVAAKYLWYAFQAARKGKSPTDRRWISERAKSIGDKQTVRIIEKNLESSDFDQGGALVPLEVAEDIIGFLHGMTVFRDLEPMTMTLSNGDLVIPRLDSAVTASWRGETATINASTPDTGDVRLSERYLMILVIISDKLIKNSNASVLDLIREEMRKSATTKEELDFLRGTGANSEPEGIRNLVSSSNQDVDRQQSGSESDSGEIIGDLVGAQERVYGAGSDALRVRPAYVMQHRTKMALQGLTDADGNPTVLGQMVSDDDLFGARVGVTSQLPENLDIDSSGDTDHTELYFAEFSEVMIGDGLEVEIEETSEATVLDGNGNPVRLFNSGQRAMKLEQATDVALRHPTSAMNYKNVDWGADILNA